MLIRTKESSMRNLKGKNVSEFQRNLISIGWPGEMPGDTPDKIKCMESKIGRPIRSTDLPNLGRSHARDVYKGDK